MNCVFVSVFLCIVLIISVCPQATEMTPISSTARHTSTETSTERSSAHRETEYHGVYDPEEQPIMQWTSGVVTYGVYQRYQQMINEKKGLAPIQP